jgi:hypothetical protein
MFNDPSSWCRVRSPCTGAGRALAVAERFNSLCFSLFLTSQFDYAQFTTPMGMLATPAPGHTRLTRTRGAYGMRWPLYILCYGPVCGASRGVENLKGTGIFLCMHNTLSYGPYCICATVLYAPNAIYKSQFLLCHKLHVHVHVPHMCDIVNCTSCSLYIDIVSIIIHGWHVWAIYLHTYTRHTAYVPIYIRHSCLPDNVKYYLQSHTSYVCIRIYTADGRRQTAGTDGRRRHDARCTAKSHDYGLRTRHAWRRAAQRRAGRTVTQVAGAGAVHRALCKAVQQRSSSR